MAASRDVMSLRSRAGALERSSVQALSKNFSDLMEIEDVTFNRFPRAGGLADYVRDGYRAFANHPSLSVVIAKCWYSWFVVPDRTSVFL